MTNLVDMLWKIDNLRITLFYDKDLREEFFGNDKNSKLEKLFGISADFIINQKNNGRVFEVGPYDPDLKIELNCQNNLIDFRVISLVENDLSIDGIINAYESFLDRISKGFEILGVSDVIRVALGVELKQELTSDQTKEVATKILSISNIENYSEIQILLNKFGTIHDDENELRINQIVEIEKTHEIISNIQNSGFIPLPVTSLKDICLLKLDINTNPHSVVKIKKINNVIGCLKEAMYKILNEGLK